jgi:hypothetical protein
MIMQLTVRLLRCCVVLCCAVLCFWRCSRWAQARNVLSEQQEMVSLVTTTSSLTSPLLRRPKKQRTPPALPVMFIDAHLRELQVGDNCY